MFVDGDSDLKLAILLSLQDAPVDTTVAPPGDSNGKDDNILSATRSTPSGDPFSPQYTTVVTRVPNRSVEDLVMGFEARARVDVSPPLSLGRRVSVSPPRSCCELPEGSTQRRRIHSSPPPSSRDINCAEFLATCSRITGGGHRPGQSSSSEDVSLPGGAGVGCDYDDVAPVKANPFGLIKDIRVTNIVATETDKTKEFAKKDLRYVLGDTSVDSLQRDDIFEPRQPATEQEGIEANDDGVTQHTAREQRLYQMEVGDEIRNNCRMHIGSREMAMIDVGHNDLQTARRQRNTPSCHGNVNILLDNVQLKEERQRMEEVVAASDGGKEGTGGASGAEESADELVINSEVLESLLQGAEQYLHDNNNPGVSLPLLPLKCHSQGEPLEDEGDPLVELSIEEHTSLMRHLSETTNADDVQTQRLLLSPECHSDSSDGEERDAVFV